MTEKTRSNVGTQKNREKSYCGASTTYCTVGETARPIDHRKRLGSGVAKLLPSTENHELSEPIGGGARTCMATSRALAKHTFLRSQTWHTPVSDGRRCDGLESARLSIVETFKPKFNPTGVDNYKNDSDTKNQSLLSGVSCLLNLSTKWEQSPPQDSSVGIVFKIVSEKKHHMIRKLFRMSMLGLMAKCCEDVHHQSHFVLFAVG